MEIFQRPKGGPPKIGGPVRPNSSNMPKAGPEQKCLKKWNCPARNTTVQLSTPYTDFERHRRTGRRQYDANSCSTIG